MRLIVPFARKPARNLHSCWLPAFLGLLVPVILAIAAGCGAAAPVTIRYAAWNLGNPERNSIERGMVAAFEKANPSIRVEIDEAFVAGYDAALKEASTSGSLPDVFQYAGNPQAETNGWCADLSGIVSDDPEWQALPEWMRRAATVDGRVVAIPQQAYLYGYYCNETLFSQSGIEPPNGSWSVDDFKSAVESTTDLSSGRIGLADEASIPDWYAAAVDDRFGWYSWDGGRLNLDAPAYVDGVLLARSLVRERCCPAGLSEADKTAIGSADGVTLWQNGAAALLFDGTWNAGIYEDLSFEASFLGMPGGRTCIVPDFAIVSKDSSNPEAAYRLCRFLSGWSTKGYETRLRLAEERSESVASIPMTGDATLEGRWARAIGMKGLAEAISGWKISGYVEGTKILPGYAEARWTMNTGIEADGKPDATIGQVIESAVRGSVDIEAVASQLDSIANECVQIYPKPLDN